MCLLAYITFSQKFPGFRSEILLTKPDGLYKWPKTKRLSKKKSARDLIRDSASFFDNLSWPLGFHLKPHFEGTRLKWMSKNLKWSYFTGNWLMQIYWYLQNLLKFHIFTGTPFTLISLLNRALMQRISNRLFMLMCHPWPSLFLYMRLKQRIAYL